MIKLIGLIVLALAAVAGLAIIVIAGLYNTRDDRFRKKAKPGTRCKVSTRFGGIRGTIKRRDLGRVLIDGDLPSPGMIAYLEWHDLEDIYPL